jgi:hypothetical protein
MSIIRIFLAYSQSIMTTGEINKFPTFCIFYKNSIKNNTLNYLFFISNKIDHEDQTEIVLQSLAELIYIPPVVYLTRIIIKSYS